MFFTVIKYLNRIIKTEDTLLLEAFGVSKSFHRQNKYSWYSNVNNLLQFLDIDIKMLETNKSKLKRRIYRKLKLKYDNLWRSEINHENKKFGNKLRTYCSFNNNIILEKYLLILIDEQRVLYTKFGISAHKLEKGKRKIYWFKS